MMEVVNTSTMIETSKSDDKETMKEQKKGGEKGRMNFGEAERAFQELGALWTKVKTKQQKLSCGSLFLLIRCCFSNNHSI